MLLSARNHMKLTEELCVRHNMSDCAIRSTRTKNPSSRLAGYVVLQGLDSDNEVGEIALKRLWYEVLDTIIAEMNSRFGGEQLLLMKCARGCLPHTDQFMDLDTVEAASKICHVNIDSSEVSIFRKFVLQKLSRGAEFDCLATLMVIVDKDVFPTIHFLLQYLLTLPMTSCTVERMFSTMARVKTKHRTTMLTIRLSNLSILSFERELVSKVSYDNIIDIFKQKPRRLLF